MSQKTWKIKQSLDIIKCTVPPPHPRWSTTKCYIVAFTSASCKSGILNFVWREVPWSHGFLRHVCMCVCTCVRTCLNVLMPIIKRQRKEREKSDTWCQDVQRSPSKISPSNNMPCFSLCLGDFCCLEVVNLFLLRVFQFLTKIIYCLEITTIEDQNWHPSWQWIQHKDIFTVK